MHAGTDHTLESNKTTHPPKKKILIKNKKNECDYLHIRVGSTEIRSGVFIKEHQDNQTIVQCKVSQGH